MAEESDMRKRETEAVFERFLGNIKKPDGEKLRRFEGKVDLLNAGKGFLMVLPTDRQTAPAIDQERIASMLASAQKIGEEVKHRLTEFATTAAEAKRIADEAKNEVKAVTAIATAAKTTADDALKTVGEVKNNVASLRKTSDGIDKSLPKNQATT